VLNDRAVGNAASRRDALRQRLALASGVESGHCDRALGRRIDDPVELGHEQSPAHQGRRIAKGGDRDVKPGARFRSGDEICRYDHRGDVAVAQGRAMDVEAQVLKHRLNGFFGERRVAQGVAGALKTDHEPIADQLAVARAPQNRDVLDTNRSGGRCGEAKNEREKQPAHHPPLTLTEPSGWTAPDTVTPLSLLRTLTTSPIEPSCNAAPFVMMTRPPSE
jgi:hypothetical protein